MVKLALKVKEHFDVLLTAAELTTVLTFMGAPAPGTSVTREAFTRIVTPNRRRGERRVAPTRVIDIQLSAKKGDEVSLTNQQFTKLEPALNVGSWGSEVYLWYKAGASGGKKSNADEEKRMGGPVVDVLCVPDRKTSTMLTANKYTLVGGANTNQGLVNFGGSSVYLWYKRDRKPRFPLLDICITKGNAKVSPRGRCACCSCMRVWRHRIVASTRYIYPRICSSFLAFINHPPCTPLTRRPVSFAASLPSTPCLPVGIISHPLVSSFGIIHRISPIRSTTRRMGDSVSSREISTPGSLNRTSSCGCIKKATRTSRLHRKWQSWGPAPALWCRGK